MIAAPELLEGLEPNVVVADRADADAAKSVPKYAARRRAAPVSFVRWFAVPPDALAQRRTETPVEANTITAPFRARTAGRISSTPM